MNKEKFDGQYDWTDFIDNEGEIQKYETSITKDQVAIKEKYHYKHSPNHCFVITLVKDLLKKNCLEDIVNPKGINRCPSLVFIDLPYGLYLGKWDYKSFGKRELERIVNNVRAIPYDKCETTTRTWVIFCASQKELEISGYLLVVFI